MASYTHACLCMCTYIDLKLLILSCQGNYVQYHTTLTLVSLHFLQFSYQLQLQGNNTLVNTITIQDSEIFYDRDTLPTHSLSSTKHIQLEYAAISIYVCSIITTVK